MTAPPGPARLDAALATHAAARPDAVALVADGRTTTWRELDALVERGAAALRADGVGPGSRVGVLGPRGHDTVVALHAVLRAGAVAAPLDPADPPARLAAAAAGAGLDALLPTTAARDRAATVAGRAPGPADLVRLDPAVDPADDPGRGPDDAYVLFTSGSTGVPKGVLLTHDNVGHFTRWAAAAAGLGPGDRVGAQAAFTFDLSTFDLFAAAHAGAATVVLPDELRPFPSEVAAWLAEESITAFYAVPTLYQALLDRAGLDAAAVPALRALLFAGEPFAPAALATLVERFGGRLLLNLYGPTETNVCTATAVAPGWTPDRPITVGTAIDGVEVTLIGDDGAPVAGAGATAEIAVAGPTVLRGYLVEGRLVDPTVRIPGDARRWYRTGDLARRDGCGRLLLRGRRDDQVKVRGHRIDLGDVEAGAGGAPGVRACAAVLDPGPTAGADPDLVLLVVTDGTHVACTADGVRAHVARVLPRRMVPDRVHVVDELPLTARGKTDRRAAALVARRLVTEAAAGPRASDQLEEADRA